MDSTLAGLDGRRYTTDELLYMRTSLPVVNCVVKKLNKHAGNAGILRLPDEAFRNPDRFTCESKNLADITNTRKFQQPGKRQSGQSSDDSEYHTLSSSHTNRDYRQVSWALRQRDSSDRSSQPHSAPSGLAAQQSENFQRFFRAVVSPTHVRVTAGGRIVPNTRSAPPPAFEWSGEKLHFERTQNPSDDQNPFQPIPWLHSAPPQSGFPPLIPGGFLPPYGLLPRGNPIGLAPMASQRPDSFCGSEQNSFESDQALKVNEEPAARLQLGAQPIKISPPNQFDQTKPFMYNGHLVYPVPQGFHPPPNALPVPITMLGNPNFLPGTAPPPNGFLPHQFLMPMPMMNPLIFPPGQQFPVAVHSAAAPPQAPESFPHVPPYLSMPTILPVSELTRSQIHGLRNYLKFIDNQITNNKHQIDEVYMQSQRQAVQVQIDTMESILANQLTYEGNLNAGKQVVEGQETIEPKPTVLKEDNKTTLVISRANPASKAQQPLTIGPGEHNTAAHITRSEKAQKIENPVDSKSAYRPQAPKSRLSANAAKAPAFQPRSQTVVSQSQVSLLNDLNKLVSSPPPDVVPFETQAQIETRLMSKCSTNWGQNTYQSNTIAPATFSRARTTLHESSSQSMGERQPPALQRYNTFHGQTASLAALNTATSMPPQGVPYLIGVLPQGVQPSDAKSSDLMYSRPLTEEELRARYLYWGKAPRAVQSGLPKFDGKDFYPPSPVKDFACPVMHSPSPVNRHNSRLPLPDFEKLFTEPGVPGYKTPPPVRFATSLETLVSVPTQPLVGNGVDYKSLLPESLAHHQRIEQAFYQPMTPPAVVNGSYTHDQDFSELFLERGVPGYRSPSPAGIKNQFAGGRCGKGDELPVTPKNGDMRAETGVGDHETRTLDSWIAPTAGIRWNPEILDISDTAVSKVDTESETSTVEIHLSPQNHIKIQGSPNRKHNGDNASFEERVANFNTKQQTLFLQNMMKNTATMAGPASSGRVSVATAQGYLPQYRGSAAASLSPAMLNFPVVDRDNELSTTKAELPKEMNGVGAAYATTNSQSENRPLNRDRPQRSIRPPTEALDAEGYMRYISKKADEDKEAIEHGWNVNTTGTGPVMGSDW